MNNDLKQFSEERLKLLELKVNYPTWDDISALARIALSLKRGEHGAEMVTRRSFDKACSEARTWRERAMKAESEIASTITCYSCRKVMTRDQHAEADGFCPHCDVEIELDDEDTYTTPQPAHTEVNYPVIPDGWKLVPIEPTYEMKLQVHPIAVGTCHNCGCEVNPDCEDNVLLSWQDMLAAAPKPESE